MPYRQQPNGRPPIVYFINFLAPPSGFMLRFQSIACLVLRHPSPFLLWHTNLLPFPSISGPYLHTPFRPLFVQNNGFGHMTLLIFVLYVYCPLSSPFSPEAFTVTFDCHSSCMPCVALFSGLCFLLRILCIPDRCCQSYCCFVRCSVESFAC